MKNGALVCLLVFLLALLRPASAASPANPKPNIILIKPGENASEGNLVVKLPQPALKPADVPDR